MSTIRSLLDLTLPPVPSSLSSSSPPLDPRIVPAIVSFNKACVLDRRRLREASNRKTIVCRAWEETGRCNYGKKCKFAHGRTELRRDSMVQQGGSMKEESTIRFRTMPCLKFSVLGACPYEDKCTYLHGPSIDIEKCISEELERDDAPPPTRSGSIDSLYSTTSSVPSVPSPIDNCPVFDPFFTPREARHNNFEIRPF
ncbi:hypothetical protein PFISCL1PPCAC_8107, partial [Pristionchus fissidentatus]